MDNARQPSIDHLTQDDITRIMAEHDTYIQNLARMNQDIFKPETDEKPVEHSQGIRADAQGFIIKDSGNRESFTSGMVRDTAAGKTNYALVADGPMFRRWAEHLTKGAEKYAKRNWMLAQGDKEYERARESAFRHFAQWFYDDRDEDHAAAVFFNINEAEYIRGNNQPKGSE